MFPGFPEETVRFFLDLRFHNETSWFHAHREAYETYVRKPFSEFIEAMTPTVMRIADDMETRPNKCLARINRDIRFTRDKSPYRDHMWLLFRRAGEEREHAVMYWFELSPEVVEWGVGFWGYNRPAMDALRERMMKKPAEVRRVLRQCGIPDETLHIYGDRYKSMKPPAGMSADLAMLYPCKEIYVKRVGVPLGESYRPEIIDRVSEDFLRLKPLYLLLRQAADEGMAKLDA
ncbi:MAG TPA: DUF2461 domain-containing protein [Candidatus Limiplasma pullistercoris]|nr:DUF2461 domain-containing protein [Candidatus Limiplasma pullistercoris]